MTHSSGKRLGLVLGAAVLLAALGCGGGNGGGENVDPASSRSGGSGGKASGSGGSKASGGNPGTAGAPGTGGAPAGTGGSSSSGSGGSTGSAGAPGADAASPGEAGASGGSTDAGEGGAAGESDAAAPSGGAPAGALGWYEAEAADNTLFGGTKIVMCGTAPKCASVAAIKEGIECCSEGKKLSQLLRGKGGVVVNKIAAPSDGMYDVTWWYHCGKNDNFRDPNCGGLPHTKSGCRPHIMEVNGTKQPKISEWPCFPGPWGELHAVTTPLPFKAGMNSIRIYSTPGNDAADLDALAIYPAGKGLPPIAGTH